MMTIETTGPWVDVVFLDGDDYDEIADFGTQEIAEHLAQWDYGQETDLAHSRDEAPWGSADYLYEVSVGGLDYVMSVNYQLGYASLNRRPVS